MPEDNWFLMLFGGGVMGSVITALLTRLGTKEANKYNKDAKLWDQTYKMVENKDKEIVHLREEIRQVRVEKDQEEEENEKLSRRVWELEQELRRNHHARNHE